MPTVSTPGVLHPPLVLQDSDACGRHHDIDGKEVTNSLWVDRPIGAINHQWWRGCRQQRWKRPMCRTLLWRRPTTMTHSRSWCR